MTIVEIVVGLLILALIALNFRDIVRYLKITMM
jgi:hypothetical protein